MGKLEGTLDKSRFKSLKFISYPSSTTTFAPILQPHVGALSKGAALVIADALPRTLMVRCHRARALLRLQLGTLVDERWAP